MFKNVELAELFECKPGNSKYTKKYCNEHSGIYEVFTGSTLQKFANLNTYDYDTPNLTFTTDGEYAGTLKVLQGFYNVGGHRKLLIPKDENIDINYFAIILQPLFYVNVKDGDVPSVNWNQILSKLTVNIPIKENGDYDLDKQKELALKYKEIDNKKRILLDKVEQLKKTKIEILDEQCDFQKISLNELFAFQGGNMKLSKEYCNIHRGEYAVYSGSTTSEPFSFLSDFDYDGDYLTWVIDGLAGYIKKINGKFSITCHRGIFIPTDKCRNIDLLYIKSVVEPIFRDKKRGRIGINGKNEYTALKPSHIKNYDIKIKIPIDKTGTFDLEKQKEIVQKIATIESIKQDLYTKVTELTKIVVI